MNHARLHALETRLSEEENNRIKETKVFQDNLAKLIHSLEQNTEALSMNKTINYQDGEMLDEELAM